MRKNFLFLFISIFLALPVIASDSQEATKTPKELLSERKALILGCMHCERQEAPFHRHPEWVTFDQVASSGTDICGDVTTFGDIVESEDLTGLAEIIYSEDCCPVNIYFSKVKAKKTSKECKNMMIGFKSALKKGGHLVIYPCNNDGTRKQMTFAYDKLAQSKKAFGKSKLTRLNSFEKIKYFINDKKYYQDSGIITKVVQQFSKCPEQFSIFEEFLFDIMIKEEKVELISILNDILESELDSKFKNILNKQIEYQLKGLVVDIDNDDEYNNYLKQYVEQSSLYTLYSNFNAIFVYKK